MKRWCSWILLLALLVVPAVRADAAGSAVLALGADLSASQRATVLSEMGITEAEAAAYETIYITNDMEHQYLDESLGASVVGTHALSSVLLIPQESGAGLSVETHNVNFCTIAMYRNALLTAGVQDAKVIVAAPSSISGTAALVGALKAYETYSGETVSEDAFSVATDELVLTGELMDELDSEQISDLIAYLKQQIAERGLDDPDKLSEVVRQASDEMDLKLTDEQVSQIVDLLLKLNKLDIDPGKLASQAKELYDKLDSLGIDLDTEKVGNFITRFVSSIWDLIQGFMSRS
ncbi:MAG: DUF1002 domain-containing protein [Lachnospiraceae bacterium]|nr:DUF1002 domain-containing protein [Lachnospiraceae bacterium]MCI9601857.1 DUF1002 domain-containing protein [Lachnospiraceae bacterium]